MTKLFKRIGLEAWLLTRPRNVRRLLRKFPIGSILDIRDGERWMVIGANESEQLIIIPEGTEYEDFDAHKQYVCAHHLREIR